MIQNVVTFNTKMCYYQGDESNGKDQLFFNIYVCDMQLKI